MIGASGAPYLNRLARRGALATRYYAISHPSLPNYLAMIGGSTFGIRSDCTQCSASGPSLPEQLERGRRGLARLHAGDAAQLLPRRLQRPLREEAQPLLLLPVDRLGSGLLPPGRARPAPLGDLRSGSLPTFGWITPDLCNDAHDCPLARSDRYLSRLVPALLPRLGRDGFLVVTFDEGLERSGLLRSPRRPRSTILAGPAVRSGARLAVRTRITHCSPRWSGPSACRCCGRPGRGADAGGFTRAPALGRTG